MSARTGKLPLLVVVLVALLVLTAASYGVSLLSLGAAAPVVALGVASLKTGLVVWFFMHLGEASVSARVAFGVMVAFIAMLCLGIAADVGLR